MNRRERQKSRQKNKSTSVWKVSSTTHREQELKRTLFQLGSGRQTRLEERSYDLDLGVKAAKLTVASVMKTNRRWQRHRGYEEKERK